MDDSDKKIFELNEQIKKIQSNNDNIENENLEKNKTIKHLD